MSKEQRVSWSRSVDYNYKRLFAFLYSKEILICTCQRSDVGQFNIYLAVMLYALLCNSHSSTVTSNGWSNRFDAFLECHCKKKQKLYLCLASWCALVCNAVPSYSHYDGAIIAPGTGKWDRGGPGSMNRTTHLTVCVHSVTAFWESHHWVMLSIWQAHNGECETAIAITSDTHEAACLGVSISHMHRGMVSLMMMVMMVMMVMVMMMRAMPRTGINVWHRGMVGLHKGGPDLTALFTDWKGRQGVELTITGEDDEQRKP